MRLRLLLTAAVCALAPGASRAADIPARIRAGAPTVALPARPSATVNQPIEKVIDQHIDAAITEAGVTPAAQADDATVIRRLTLDLVGRIPTSGEVDAYVKSTDSDKRAKLVDRLIASPGFVRHQAALFEVMLNPPAATPRPPGSSPTGSGSIAPSRRSSSTSGTAPATP